MIDVLIHGGQILDGSGNPAFNGAIAIEGDEMSIVRGSCAHISALKSIDATGKIVCPGFIDLHSHTPLSILNDGRNEPKVLQGVTTELVGVDGIGHAPFHSPQELARAIHLDAGLNGRLQGELGWRTVEQMLNAYAGRIATNIAYILGNAAVRITAMGWCNRKATQQEINSMTSLVRECLEEGAWGLSTGLDYPPGSFADTSELIALSKVVQRYGGIYHTHTRGSLSAIAPLAPWQEAISIGRSSGIAVHLTHFRQKNSAAGHMRYLEMIEKARRDGLDVTFDAYSYPYSSTALTIDLPPWTKDGGPEALLARLTDPRDRGRIREEMHAGKAADRNWAEGNWLTGFQQPHNRRLDGQSIAAIALERDQDPVDAICDLLIEEDLGICTVRVGGNVETLGAFMSHPLGMIASDSILVGEHPSPRTYGCFPHVLGHFVRQEGYLTLPEAVRKMTSFPAQRLGLNNRGILRNGMKADVVVFDAATVGSKATRTTPKRLPDGISYVLVNGVVVVDQGRHTGATPGRPLRRGRLD